MNQELFLKLNEVIADATPLKIVKRGNAFSLVEIVDKKSLSEEYEKYSFNGLNIYQSQPANDHLILNGECYFNSPNGELEMETEIKLIKTKQANNSLQISDYCFDLSEEFISITATFPIS
ncbi:MAG: hypothetical protein NE327_12715 [Lentisphaeraceae bacterium]|nr:hypothetical protein [Lentisphaeraceae bacterium]